MTATLAPTVTCGYCHTRQTKDHVRACAAAFYAGRAPAAPVRPAPPAEVPAGRYALRTDGVVKFYVVDRPTDGRWAGRTFLSVMASDEKHAIREPRTRAALLARIAEDPQAATVLYGQELGVCGRCGRTLTDEASRAAGIGPVCQDKGW